ncbi:hypothetical protein RUND412_006196 [Rhizina undulata]
MASPNAERLQLLQEHVRLSLLERKRTLSLDLEPDTRNTYEISRNLDTLHRGIEQLEKEQKRLEEDGQLSTGALREQEDILIKLRSQYDDLHAQFTNNEPPSSRNSTDQHRSSMTLNSPLLSPTIGRHGHLPYDESAAREALMGNRETPSAMRKSNKTVRFSETLVDAEELNNQQILQLHQRVMEDQDRSLDRLSESIRNQRELSIQIGDELDGHAQLLDDVDVLVTRHQERLDGAKKKLHHVAKTAKEHGSLVIIAILIIILVLLIIILKW